MVSLILIFAFFNIFLFFFFSLYHFAICLFLYVNLFSSCLQFTVFSLTVSASFCLALCCISDYYSKICDINIILLHYFVTFFTQILVSIIHFRGVDGELFFFLFPLACCGIRAINIYIINPLSLVIHALYIFFNEWRRCTDVY